MTAPHWEQRFRAGSVSLPAWAEDSPARAVAVASADGVRQVHSFDVATGELTVATDRPEGTTDAAISPDGQWLWWFDDDGGDELGVWRRQPFGSAPGVDVELATPLPAAYSAGLLLGTGARGALAVVGSSDDDGTTVHVVHDGVAHLVYSHEEDAEAAALSHDGTLLAIEHSEHGDSRHPSLRVLRLRHDDDGAIHAELVADLHDGPGKGLAVCGFAPVAGDSRLLVAHEREGRQELLIWDPVANAETLLPLTSPGEVADAEWTPAADAVVVAIDHEARTRLVLRGLDGAETPVGPSEGTVSGFTVRPDGETWLAWSSAAQPRSIRRASDHGEVVAAPGPLSPSSVAVEDVWVQGPGGPVHALLRRPEGVSQPLPVVVEVHGGPTWHDSDSFSPFLAAWVDQGYAVLTVNYRGSTGYGSAWRDALEEAVGFTELADVAAVHDDLVARGVLDPARSVLAGASWGGYLTLLGLGTQPERWTLGVAGVPVADYVAAYEDEMEPLKAFDRSLFGGSPAERPEAYRRSSPLTYVDAVAAPVLVLAGENDPRCPIRQVENYLEAIAARPDAPVVETYRYEAGHGSYADDERVAQARVQLEFVARHLP